MTSEAVQTRILGRTALITLHRPDKRNALNIDLCHQLRAAIEGATAEGIRSLVVTGEGSSFCSGADLDEVYDEAFREALYATLDVLAARPFPVIAAINGPAIGAGTQLAIAADFRMVAPSARFSVPTARIGLAVDQWTIRRLSILAGHPAARRLLLACDQMDADTALRCGLADRAGGQEAALAWAAEMAELAPLTVAYSKRVLNRIVDTAADPDLTSAFEACWSSRDLQEARQARTEGRPARFEGA